MENLGRFLITSTDFQSYLEMLLESKTVDSILGAEIKKERSKLTPSFITEKEGLKNFPLSQLTVYHYSLLNSAANSMFQSKRSLSEKVGVVARSCEIRAFVEQSKLNQTKFENLFVIGIEDVGIIDTRQLSKILKEKKISEEKVVYEKLSKDNLSLFMEDGKIHQLKIPEDVQIAENCMRCSKKSSNFVDATISTLGVKEADTSLIFTVYSKKALEVATNLGFTEKQIKETQNQEYEKQLMELKSNAENLLDKDLSEFNSRADRFDIYNKCTVCGMCVKSCPVCICPVCALTELKKDERMDPITFLMTRTSHIGDICVNCGKCNLMCPMKIPLSLIFFNLSKNLEKEYGYVAGVDKDGKTLHLRIKDVKKEATF